MAASNVYPEPAPPSAEKQPAPLDRLAELHPGDDLVEMLVARNKRIEDDEATKAAVHEEMSVRMDTGVRVNPALKRALLGEDGPGNGQADDWEVDDDEDEREDDESDFLDVSKGSFGVEVRRVVAKS